MYGNNFNDTLSNSTSVLRYNLPYERAFKSCNIRLQECAEIEGIVISTFRPIESNLRVFISSGPLTNSLKQLCAAVFLNDLAEFERNHYTISCISKIVGNSVIINAATEFTFMNIYVLGKKSPNQNLYTIQIAIKFQVITERMGYVIILWLVLIYALIYQIVQVLSPTRIFQIIHFILLRKLKIN